MGADQERTTQYVEALRPGLVAVRNELDRAIHAGSAAGINQACATMISTITNRSIDNDAYPSIFAIHSILAALLPQTVSRDLSARLLREDTLEAKTAIMYLCIPAIIGQIEEATQDEAKRNELLERAMIDILSAEFGPDATSPVSTRIHTRVRGTIDRLEREEVLESESVSRRRDDTTTSDTTVESVLRQELIETLNTLLAHLQPRQQRIVYLRIVRQLALDAVGRDLGINRQRVRQLLAPVLSALRTQLLLLERDDAVDPQPTLPRDFLVDVPDRLVAEIDSIAQGDPTEIYTKLNAIGGIFTGKISVIARAFSYQSNVYLRDIFFREIQDTAARQLLTEIVSRRDLSRGSTASTMRYTQEAEEALYSFRAFKLRWVRLQDITFKDVVRAYLSGAISDRRQIRYS